jgi:predicted  nucleic acid-binding Zn-ribbon protein
MPLKASPEDQAILLDLQALDTKLQQLAHKANTLPELATIVALKAEAEEARLAGVTDSGTLEDAHTELKRIESDVEVVEARIKRDTERLDSTSSVKDVAGLEAELTSLRKRQSDLEDIELAVMERIDELELAAQASSKAHGELVERLSRAEASRDAALATIRAESDHAQANRAIIVGKLDPELVALYERQRERYGTGASHLRGGASSASGVKLNESDMAAIRAAAPDDVVLCPDSNAILVRTAESGI